MDFLDSRYRLLRRKKRLYDSEWPEVKIINGYAVFIGYLMMGVRGLGILVVTWTTVVLLGGFVSVLGKKDFWSLTGITLVQTAGVFDFLLEEKLSDILHSLWGLLGAAFSMVLKKKGPSQNERGPENVQSRSSVEEMASRKRIALAYVLLVIQLLVLAILLCPLAVLYMLGLYISTGVSLWRLIEHDFGNADGGANLKPALEVLYSLAVAQGVLFGYKTIHAFGAKVGLAEFVSEACLVHKRIVSDYLDSMIEGCEKDPSFATGRNLVTYAVDLILESRSNAGFIAGVGALGIIIQNTSWSDGHDLAEELLTRSGLCNHTIQRLLETVSCRDPRIINEIREHAIRIVALVAEHIHLEQLPGGIHCISSLLGAFDEKQNWLLKRYDRGYRCDLRGYESLVIDGLDILEKLTVHEDNRRAIPSLPCSQVLAALREAGTTLNPEGEIWSNSEVVISTLKSVLECSKCELWSKRLVVEIVLDQSVDTSSIMAAPGSSSSRRMFIWILLDIFLLSSYHLIGMDTPWEGCISDEIIILAGQKLQAMQSSSQGEGSTMGSMLQHVAAAFEDLTKALVDAGNNKDGVHAAKILQGLCVYYTKEDEYLKELKKAMVDVMPTVLREILGYRSTREETIIPAAREASSNVPVSAAGTDLESGGNGQGNTSSCHQQDGGRELREALRELCRAIRYGWYIEDSDVRAQLDEIAAKICLEQEKPVKDFWSVER
ncbi:hypothetical protein ACP4OV_023273 [Aristida adscensionis]